MKIENKDALEFLSEIKDNSIDLILTDPPYLISKASGFSGLGENEECNKKFGSISIDFGEWDKKELDWTTLISEFKRVLRPGGTAIIWYDIFKMSEIHKETTEQKLKQPRIGMWQKTNPVPINSKIQYLSNAKEYFYLFVKGSNPTFNSQYDPASYSFPICSGKERTSHPTQKPLALTKELIIKHSNKGDIVLDCFLGSGTTAEASLLTGRIPYGCELDKDYYDNLILPRLENVVEESEEINSDDNVIIENSPKSKKDKSLSENQKKILSILQDNPTKDFSALELSMATGLPSRTCSSCISPLCSAGVAKKTNTKSPLRIQLL